MPLQVSLGANFIQGFQGKNGCMLELSMSETCHPCPEGATTAVPQTLAYMVLTEHIGGYLHKTQCAKKLVLHCTVHICIEWTPLAGEGD